MISRLLRAALLLGVLFPLVSLSGTTAAQAQAAASSPAKRPEVEATAYAPIPPGARFETQVNDDSELNQEALERVDAELVGRGYGVAGDAGLVMVIEASLIRGQKQDDPLGQAHADNNGAEVQARLFSSTQNSLLNPKPTVGSADRIFRINLSVYDRTSGLYVWRGSATRNNPDVDVSQASNEMIAELIHAVGKSVGAPPAQ